MSSTEGVQKTVHPHCVVLHYNGDVDSATVHLYTEALEDTLAGGQSHIVIDLGGVTFMSSAGWGTVLGFMHKVRQKGGDLHLACLPDSLQTIFQISDFSQVIRSFKSVNEAVAAFG